MLGEAVFCFGDDMNIEATGDPVVTCPHCNMTYYGAVGHNCDQAWFWTPEWQDGEREAEADLAAGRYEEYDSVDEFIASLDQKAAQLDLRRALDEMRRTHGDEMMTAMLQTQLVEMAEARDDWRELVERAIAEVAGDE